MRATGYLFVVLLMSSVGCRAMCPVAGRSYAPQAEAEIVAMMERSAFAWTANDLDGFMAGFHNSPELRFATPGGITMGWDNLKHRYAKSIEKSDLRFSDLDIDVLSPSAALVFGRFHNDMKDGGYGTGLYTLLVRKIDGVWVIVHDHSSDLPVEPGQ